MNVSYKCLKCGKTLLRCVHSMNCRECGAHWPILNGVPTYDSGKYFGEVPQETMQELVAAAEKGNWLTAAQAMFKDSNSEMYQYIADLNRASWIPILPIGPKSTVLDVGSGLGVLTHALALQFEKVVSIEPIAERIDFTRVRLEQEGLKNVDLVQTTLDALPFFDETFDLVVLNGILEWVGEWRLNESPREAQIEVLTTLRRLLKPGGMVLIGIENRIGWDSFLGRVDHPGTRFTSLMPRWLASLYIKLKKPNFYRTLIASMNGYRTYTYSPRGYFKLLREAGLPCAELWWPAQGYNLPHVMFRAADRGQIEAHFLRARNFKNRVNGYAWRRALKDWMLVRTRLFNSMFPDVILMARSAPSVVKVGADSPSLPEAIQQVVLNPLASSQVKSNEKESHTSVLISHSFRNKAIIISVDASGEARAITKVANAKLPDAATVESAYQWLQRMHKESASPGHPLQGSIPSPLAFLRVGSLIASVESVVQGRPFEDICMVPDYFHSRERVEHHLGLIVRWLGTVKPALESLRSEGSGDEIPASWWNLSAERSSTGKAQGLNRRGCMQHGDFFPDNIFLHEETWRISVIDWDQCGDGYPFLFDWFCLVTGMYYTHTRISRLPKGQTVDDLSFRQTYFEPSWFSELVVESSYQLCDLYGIERTMVRECFRYYLAVRYHQFKQKSEIGDKKEWRDRYRGFYDCLVKHEHECIFSPKYVGRADRCVG